jgi:glycosyltransferase involved in cell wall biosynthesis
MYGLAFRGARLVLFQNEEDQLSFIRMSLVSPDRAARLPGSGVDLDRFRPAAEAATKAETVFLFVGRLLRDKGICEYAASASAVRKQHANIRFQVLGALDANDRAVVSKRSVDAWQREGIIEYLGVADDVRPIMAAADCVVLPSYYREGVPRSLLEAAAMGKPCITTEATGCRDAVDNGVTGYLCEARSTEALTQAMLRFLSASIEDRRAMGRAGRAKMERSFSEQIVLDRYVSLASEIAVAAQRPYPAPDPQSANH